jgi:DNA polymerase III delta subunit
MLYFLYGNDTDKARARAVSLVSDLRQKKPDAAVFKMEGDSFDRFKLEELISGQGLFENRHIVLLSRIFDNVEAKTFLLSRLKEIADSKNIFILRENALAKTEAEQLKKIATRHQEFVKKSVIAPAKNKFNIFSLADALARRDRKSLWLLYQQALANNVSPEEVHGVLFWKIKVIAAAAAAKTAAPPGQKPFVFNKAKKAAANFAPGEIGRLSAAFVSVYHAAHTGGSDLAVGLEKIILTI